MAIITYEHYGALVFVDENLKGKHRENCLCWKCGSFKPGMPENCPIAQKLYKICVKESLVTPVYECPVFVELPVQKKSGCSGCDNGVPHTHATLQNEAK